MRVLVDGLDQVIEGEVIEESSSTASAGSSTWKRPTPFVAMVSVSRFTVEWWRQSSSSLLPW